MGVHVTGLISNNIVLKQVSSLDDRESKARTKVAKFSGQYVSVIFFYNLRHRIDDVCVPVGSRNWCFKLPYI